jgi:hypothetical protein
VWEEGAPEGEEPIEWIGLPSVPTTTLAQAWERVNWYRASFRVEDYHQCLKTGCRIEERQLQSAERLLGLLGLLSPLAVRLLQWRDLSRQAPERPAQTVIEPEILTVPAAHVGLSPASMTVGTDLGLRSRAWEVTWHAVVTDLLAGKPFGKAGSTCKLCLRAST